MLVTLPVAVGKLVEICAKGDSRYMGTTGVQVTDCENGLWRCCATDGRFLAVVQGRIEIPPGYTPHGLADAGCKSVIVPAEPWKEIFKGKGGPLVVISSDSKAIALERVERGQITRSVNGFAVEGRFPDFKGVIPNVAPKAFVSIDPGYLAAIAKVCESIIKEDTGAASVQFGFYPSGGTSGGVFGLCGKRQLDPTIVFDGLVAPLADPKDDGKPTNGQPQEKEESEDTEEVAATTE